MSQRIAYIQGCLMMQLYTTWDCNKIAAFIDQNNCQAAHWSPPRLPEVMYVLTTITGALDNAFNHPSGYYYYPHYKRTAGGPNTGL